MTKVLLYGCGGKMGAVVEKLVSENPQCEIVAGVDPRSLNKPYPTFTDIKSCNIATDVIIDFSTATAMPGLLEYIKKTHIPAVICTTGLSDEINKEIIELSKETAILKSANMSLGVNLLFNLVKKAAEILYSANFDIEIIEKHHNQKIDAPSGTAIAIADEINSALDNKMEYVFDRSKVREKRTNNQIGISALRGGTIVGEHDVVFAGQDEIFTISHTALSKEIFAVGAVSAALFLKGKKSGLYSMQDVIM